MTRPFCGDCTRARLTTDGKLVTCLFATTGTDLRAPLREGAADEALRALVESVWLRRADRYSEIRAEATPPLRARSKKIEMYQLGG